MLIVGAGPAGLVTGIGLARHGVRSMLIERHPSTSIFPRATGVSTRSMEIFRGWGLDDAVRRGGWRVIPRMAIADAASTTRHRWRARSGSPTRPSSAAVSPTTAAVSPQDHLEPVLLEHYRALGGDARFSMELVGFEQDAEGVRATIRDLVTGAETEVRVRLPGRRRRPSELVRSTLGIADGGPGRPRPVLQHPVPGRPLRGPRRAPIRAVHARRRRTADRPRPERDRRPVRVRDPAPARHGRGDGRGDVPAGSLRGPRSARPAAGRISTSRSWRRARSRSRRRSRRSGASAGRSSSATRPTG